MGQPKGKNNGNITVVKNVRIILQHEIISGYLTIKEGRIFGIEKGEFQETVTADTVIDGAGQYLSPGFVELHSHGAGGYDFMDNSPEAVVTAARTLLQHGATTLLPTTVSASLSEMKDCLANFLEAKKHMTKGPFMPGLHLEGPYLNPIYAGAMEKRFLRLPHPHEYMALLEQADGAIARWTVAPELEGALEMGDRLQRHNILLSAGHSAAMHHQMLEAFQHGYTHITHLFSAMSSITRQNGFRHCGLQESAFLMNDVTVEVIADGCHLPPELLRLVHTAKGARSTCLITDSMRAAGTNQRESLLGGKHNNFKVLIEDDVAKLPDRSGFAGSIATSDRLVRVMAQEAGVSLVDSVRMASLTPAEILGIDGQKGSICVGKDADLLLFNNDISISWVMIAGEIVSAAIQKEET